MKKTPEQLTIIRDHVRFPALWTIVEETKYYIHIRHRVTGRRMVCRKE